MTPTPPNLPSFEREQQHPEKPSLARRIMALPNGSLIIGFFALMALIGYLFPVPGFLEAQTRSKISRAQADLRTLSTALSQYRSDHASLPSTLHTLTTPVAYVGSLPGDPWADTRGLPYLYHTNGTTFVVGSFGPDSDEKTGGDLPWSDAEAMNALLENETRLLPFSYDPSNGTFSEGDFWRVGGAPTP